MSPRAIKVNEAAPYLLLAALVGAVFSFFLGRRSGKIASSARLIADRLHGIKERRTDDLKDIKAEVSIELKGLDAESERVRSLSDDAAVDEFNKVFPPDSGDS